jgi:C4-dicarboxylate transporter
MRAVSAIAIALIAPGQCSYLAIVSDKWLYIADDSNLRIIRVKLDYHAEKRVAIGRH